MIYIYIYIYIYQAAWIQGKKGEGLGRGGGEEEEEGGGGEKSQTTCVIFQCDNLVISAFQTYMGCVLWEVTSILSDSS